MLNIKHRAAYRVQRCLRYRLQPAPRHQVVEDFVRQQRPRVHHSKVIEKLIKAIVGRRMKKSRAPKSFRTGGAQGVPEAVRGRLHVSLCFHTTCHPGIRAKQSSSLQFLIAGK
jgi:hypothetical protein